MEKTYEEMIEEIRKSDVVPNYACTSITPDERGGAWLKLEITEAERASCKTLAEFEALVDKRLAAARAGLIWSAGFTELEMVK